MALQGGKQASRVDFTGPTGLDSWEFSSKLTNVHTTSGMLKTRIVPAIALVAGLGLGLYSFSHLRRTLDMSITTKAEIQPKIRLDMVSVDSSDDVPKVQLVAHVSNPSADTPITILRWNSVLDPKAGLLGVASLRNHKDAKDIDIPSIMINRQMPPPKEDYLRIEPGSSISNAVTLVVADSGLQTGVEYEVSAEGQFMEIYRGEDEEPVRVVPYSCEPVRFTA